MFFCTKVECPLNIRHAHACGDWLRYNLIVHVFMSIVSSTLQQRRRFRFVMLPHSIRSSNTLSLGSGKPNCDIRVMLRVRCSRSYISDQIFNYYFTTKARAFSIPMINTLRIWLPGWPSGLSRWSVVRLVRATGPQTRTYVFVFHKHIFYGWAWPKILIFDWPFNLRAKNIAYGKYFIIAHVNIKGQK